MPEKHPFGDFIPPNAKYFLLGSFATKPKPGYEWFYANGRNQFWPILEEVYGLDLKTTIAQKKLFTNLKMAVSDSIIEAERLNGSHLDVNLKNIVINSVVRDIVTKNRLEKIYFSSKFAETLYKRHFKDLIRDYPNINLITLPSPSPRYTMSKAEKVSIYKELMPKLV